MRTFKVTIGWTLNSRTDRDYVSFADGYREGAPQQTITFELEWVNPTFVPDDIRESLSDTELVPLELEAERRNHTAIAEAAFIATNHPFPRSLQGIAAQILGFIDDADYDGTVPADMEDRWVGHYSLSVGDTVEVDGVRYACASLGWERVS